MQNYTRTLFTTGNRIAERRARDLEHWAKGNAPWTDRTGAARRGLHTTVEQDAVIVAQITLSHGVEYGLWLEIANGGKYAIIARAIDTYGPIFMQDLQRLLNLRVISAG